MSGRLTEAYLDARAAAESKREDKREFTTVKPKNETQAQALFAEYIAHTYPHGDTWALAHLQVSVERVRGKKKESGQGWEFTKEVVRRWRVFIATEEKYHDCYGETLKAAMHEAMTAVGMEIPECLT